MLLVGDKRRDTAVAAVPGPCRGEVALAKAADGNRMDKAPEAGLVEWAMTDRVRAIAPAGNRGLLWDCHMGAQETAPGPAADTVRWERRSGKGNAQKKE